MNLRIICFTALAAISTLSAHCPRCENLHSIRHFHAGPESESNPISDPDEGLIYVEEEPDSSHCYRGSWSQIYVNPCAATWHECDCPLYDDSDIIDEHEVQATWPGKRDNNWMYELNY